MKSARYNASTLLDANLEAGRGARTAIYFGAEQITYAELYQQVCAMGWTLHEWGIVRENRVLLVLGDTPAFPSPSSAQYAWARFPLPSIRFTKLPTIAFFWPTQKHDWSLRARRIWTK